MCSEHPPTQLQKEGPWEGASSLVSTNSFHTDQWAAVEQKCLFILSSPGCALACDLSPPSQTRGQPGIYDKSLPSPLWFSLWHHSLSNVAVSNCFKSGPCFYFYRNVSALWILVSPAYGVNHPPQAAWGIKQTVPSSRGNMINIFIGFTGEWFSVDKAALVLCHHTDIRASSPHSVVRLWVCSVSLCCAPPHLHLYTL